MIALKRVSLGEWIAGGSAVLLFVLMFFDWFGVKTVSTSNLLGHFTSVLPPKNAWEALDFIPVVLVVTSSVPLAVVAMRLSDAVHRPLFRVNALAALLGAVSALLILIRILDPPVFDVSSPITLEGAVQLPVFLALLAAIGIACGGCWALREELS